MRSHRSALSLLVLSLTAVPAAVRAQDAADERAEREPAPAPERVVRGLVLDAASRPLGGARIAVRPRSEPGRPEPSTAELLAVPVATSAADGRFDVRLEAGTRLVVGADGHATVEVSPPDGAVDCDVVLPRGGTLVGSVRDVGGALLPGVEVVAGDALAEVPTLRGMAGRRSVPRVVARTDARGLFRVDGVLRTAIVLRCTAEGHAPFELRPHALGEPLVIELEPAAVVRGRILDADGRPVDRATVRADGDAAAWAAPARTAADGAFTLTTPVAEGLRVVAEARVDGALQRVEHGPVAAPSDGLVLTLERIAADADRPLLRVVAVERATGAAPASVRAAVAWGAAGPGRIPELAHRQLGAGFVDGVAGEVALPVPADARAGVLLVGAPGCAWTRVEDVAPPSPDDAPLRVELVAEAVLRGRVVDPESGRGVAGARVGWVPHAGGRLRHMTPADRIESALEPATTGADGEFELRGVPAGLVEIVCDAPGRPPIEALEVDVAEGSVRDGLSIDAPEGRTLRGTVEGLAEPVGHRVAARPLAADPGVFVRVAERAAQLGADGRFAILGLAPGFYVLDLLPPREPRSGAEVRIPLEPFRVRAAADPAPRTVDAAGDRPGALGGRVAVRGGLARTRLAVVAEDEARQQFVHPTYAFGVLALPGADGRFDAAVRPGRYRVRVFDVGTGVEVARREGVEVRAGRPVDLELVVEVVPLQVTVTPSAPDAALRGGRVEILVEWPPSARGTSVQNLGAPYDSGLGVALRRGVVPIELFVPPLPTTVRLWPGAGRGAGEDQDRKGAAPLAEREVTPEAGGRAQVELVEPPPDRG